MTVGALAGFGLGKEGRGTGQNMFAWAVSWLYHRELDATDTSSTTKFARKPEILKANVAALHAGYNYGDDRDFVVRYEVGPRLRSQPAPTATSAEPGAVLRFDRGGPAQRILLFLGSYPITPASDILHELGRHKRFNVTVPGRGRDRRDRAASARHTEGTGRDHHRRAGPRAEERDHRLAVALELPLLVVDVQRGGPSTGCPPRPSRPICRRCTGAMANHRWPWLLPSHRPTASMLPSRRSDRSHLPDARTAAVRRIPGQRTGARNPAIPDLADRPTLNPGFADRAQWTGR